jgi:hypothetical protein
LRFSSGQITLPEKKTKKNLTRFVWRENLTRQVAFSYLTLFREVIIMVKKIVLLRGENPAQTGTMEFGAGASGALISAFLAAHSNAGVVGLDSVNSPALETPPDDPDAGANADRKCYLSFLREGESQMVVVSDPTAASEMLPEGERLTTAGGQSLVESYGSMMNITDLAFINGTITQGI